MSFFLQNILIDAGKKESVYLTESIEIIKKEITKLKSVINEFMKDKYVELEPYLRPDEILIIKNEKLITDINNLQSRIENQVKVKLSSSLKELQNLSIELKEYNYGLNLSSQLLQIQKGFESLENRKINKDQQYSVAATTLVSLHTLIIEKSSDIQKLNIYLALKEEYYKIYDNFIQELIALWQEKICWSDNKKSSMTVSVSLEIQCESNLLIDIIQALNTINKLQKCIEFLSIDLLEYFIKPIIKFNCTVQNIDKTFTIEILDKKQLPPYQTVLNNLQLLFQFLHKHFNILVQNNEYFLKKLSIPLLQEFSLTLNNECISKIIPTSTSELGMFKTTVSEIEEFKNYLLKIRFINEENIFLSEYTYNIDKLYIDKKCERLLEIARTIMKKDLHDSFKYKPEILQQFDNPESIIENYNIMIDKKLSKHIFMFPECQISKSAQEIICLVEEILKEACDSNDKYLLRLFYTSRNIFEMYGALLPEIHKSFLQTIPQQVALFHNNCFYLAHCLLTLIYKYQQKIKLSQNFCMIYTDQILLLRQVGSEYFLNHMKYQRDIIFGILRESGLSSIGQIPELPATTERALRQCVRQLELLKTVWIEILPITVYCRAVGCIVNDMVDDLCSKVVNVEDIPADVTSELVTLFNMVVKRIPQIFPNAILIEQFVPKWRKLKELIIILGASLKEIEDRWADGKGPLANEFSSQHVKQLIRALFQNTERRSNLLSKIKEK